MSSITRRSNRSRRYAATALLPLTLSLGCGTRQLEAEKQALVDQLAVSQQESAAKNEHLASLTQELLAIYSLLDQLEREENRLFQQLRTPGEQLLRSDDQQLPSRRLDLFKQYLQASQERIAALEQKIEEAATIETDSDAAVMASLRTTLSRYDARQRELERQLTESMRLAESYNRQLNKLRSELGETKVKLQQTEATLDEAKEEIQSLTDERVGLEIALSTGHYIVGEKSELLRTSILERYGTFKRQLRVTSTEELDHLDMIAIDTSRQVEIELGDVKKVELLPSRPSKSYQLVRSEAGTQLVIQRPSDFWSSGRLLVIVVKER